MLAQGLVIFFFSSRRRHTRFDCDWSSDVCSSDLVREAMMDLQRRVHALHTQMIQLGQDRGEIRGDLPAAEIAHVFRQTIFGTLLDRKSTPLNSSHSQISYAVFCLKKKNTVRCHFA